MSVDIKHDDQCPLIIDQINDEPLQINEPLAHEPNIIIVQHERTQIIPSMQKNYGSLSIPSQCPINQTLTYTWNNLDVFGESRQTISTWTQITSKLYECCRSNGRIPNPRKHLLQNINGIARSGELLAVMGSSGAGKTTLLNALAFRSSPGVQIAHSSVRALNGVPIGAKELRERSAYVQQDDLFIGSLTTREHLIFQAILRMSRHTTYKQKLHRVEEVLNELCLTKCKNTIIGTPGRVKGLSGGERKRLAFASEILTDPALLLCDEPTSGLDSFMAHSVLQVLKKLAEKGKTVIVTIHQPSSELFALFDKILLMAEGRVAFLGTAHEASEFFQQLNIPCPSNYNPADYYIQRIAIVPGQEQESRTDIKRICDAYVTGPLAKNVMDSTLEIQKCSNGYLASVDGTGQQGYRATWCTQFRVILWRSWLTVLKEPMLVKVRLIQTIIIALIIGVIFYGQQMDQNGVINMNGALFLFLVNMTFQNVFGVVNVFCLELPVFLRETKSKLYSSDTYFLGKTIAELPLFILVPFLFITITYPMIGLRPTFISYLNAFVIMALVANTATSFGYLISCASSSISMALSIGPPFIIPFLLFGGFFLNSGSVPVYFQWLSYFSWFRYGFEGLLINQWGMVTDGDIACTRANISCPSSGQVILETLNFNKNNFEYDFLALFVLIIIFRFMAFICLYLRSRSKE